MSYLFLILVGYLLGSLPFGLMAGRLVKGVDVRDFGSGSTGSTNVQRTVGTPAAVVVLLLDTAKSVLAVLLARLFSDAPGVEVAAALAAIAGHNWPVFIGFKGGRGIAPGVGGAAHTISCLRSHRAGRRPTHHSIVAIRVAGLSSRGRRGGHHLNFPLPGGS